LHFSANSAVFLSDLRGSKLFCRGLMKLKLKDPL